MYITYHKDVNQSSVNKIAHCVLNEKIQYFINSNNCEQTMYMYSYNSNHSYMFIHLINGDRIDISI